MDKFRSRGTLRCEIYEEGCELQYRAYFTPDTSHHAKHDEGEFAVFVSSDGNCAIGRKLEDKCILIEIRDNWKKVINNYPWNTVLVEVLIETQAIDSAFRLVGIKIPAK